MQKLPDGEPFYVAGEYRVVEPPSRLVFTWTWEDPAEKVRDIALSQAPVGIFGRRVEQDHVLADRDRVEIYRPLIAEPKAARRRRALRPTRR